MPASLVRSRTTGVGCERSRRSRRNLFATATEVWRTRTAARQENFVPNLQDALSADAIICAVPSERPWCQSKDDTLKTPGETQRLNKEFLLMWA